VIGVLFAFFLLQLCAKRVKIAASADSVRLFCGCAYKGRLFVVQKAASARLAEIWLAQNAAQTVRPSFAD
jgi:hypothetical protein